MIPKATATASAQQRSEADREVLVPVSEKRLPRIASDRTRWGIINPWGDVWTHHTFETRDQAMRYLTQFWGGEGALNGHCRGFTFEIVNTEVSRFSDGALGRQDETPAKSSEPAKGR